MAPIRQPLPRDLAEFAELRATIRQRGTARVWIAWASVAVWATLCFVVLLDARAPILSLLTLIALAAGFEAVFALHVGVERIGRYLQVFHETDRTPGWETVAMSVPRHLSGGPDPLFGTLFFVATVLNLLPVALVGVPVEIMAIGAAHTLFASRLVHARLVSRRQRAADLAGFVRLAASLDRGQHVSAAPETTD